MIGDRIRQVRLHLGDTGKLSQTKFAEMLGLSRDAISAYELGKVEPPALLIKLLNQKFEISERWLLTGDGPMIEDATPEQLDIIDKFSAILNNKSDSVIAIRVLNDILSFNTEQWKALDTILHALNACDKKDPED